jgi:RNA polymerase sigma-70 factor (ECF subfamily)
MALGALTEANQDRPFADLVTPLIPAAQRLAYGMLQNAHDCEDAVQEATFKAWRAYPRLREGSNHRAWFLTIVANECKQRRRNRWWSILKLAAPDHEDPASPGVDGTSMDLRRAVARLPSCCGTTWTWNLRTSVACLESATKRRRPASTER